MKIYIRLVILFLIGTFPLAKLEGQVLENYNPFFEISHRYEPFFSPEKASVEINLQDFPHSEFRLGVPRGSSVFVENVLWFFAEQDTSLTVKSEWIRNQFPGEASVRKVNILKRDLQPRELSLHKGYFTPGERIKTGGIEVSQSMEKRKKDTMRDFFYLGLVIVMLLTAFYKVVFPVIFVNMLKPSSVFTAEDFADTSARSRVFSTDLVFYLIIFNMLLMLMIVSAVYYLEISFLKNIIRHELNFMFLFWLLGSVVLFVLSVVKLFWLKIATAIYGIGRLEFIHFYYMLRVISYSLLVLFTVLILGISNNLMEVGQMMVYLLGLFFILYIGGVSMLYFFMTKKVSFKNYHLFSYLCTAELIPFLIVTKLIIG
jgi:hypothetical protein